MCNCLNRVLCYGMTGTSKSFSKIMGGKSIMFSFFVNAYSKSLYNNIMELKQRLASDYTLQ